MKLIFAPPSLDDLVQLLRAWRLWLAAAFVGVLLAAVLYYLAPPPFRARATANVDFNLEQAWPQDSDRQQFYYLERESRKLEEIAWSDQVLGAVVDAVPGVTLRALRDGKLLLSQPAEAGWHFYADDPDPQRAADLASGWAQAFVTEAQAQVQSGAINQYVRLEATQVNALPIERRVPLAVYLVAGLLIAWFLAAFFVLFFRPAQAAK